MSTAAAPAAEAHPPPATAITALRAELRRVLDAAADRDAADLVDAIGALETLGRCVSAAQAELTGRLDALLCEEQREAGVRAEDVGKGVAHVVAAARRESPHRGRRHLGLARVAPAELPHTWAAWQDGRIDEWTATMIARETACLPIEHRRAVDETVVGDTDIDALSLRQLVARLRAESERLDPASCLLRRRQAESDRRVTLRPAPDTMTWLTALLPVKDGVAVYAALRREADRARADGDERGRGQVMADTLVATMLGSAPGRSAVPVALGLVMSDSALFAGADDEAYVDGFGPIPAELAREIVCDALSAEEKVSIRRLYTTPEAGELVTMESRARTFRGNLARFIHLRDRTCRTPWCDAPVRHVDHVVPAGEGGPTAADNAQGLCEACNYAKSRLRWTSRRGDGGSVETTLPTGHRLTSRPPPLATIHWRRIPPLVVDYYLSA